MKQEDYKMFVKKHDRQVGIYKPTETYKEKREKRLDSVPEKVLFMAQALIDNNIEFQVLECLCKSRKKVTAMLTDLYIPKYNIAMRYVDMDDEESVALSQIFFNMMKQRSYPFFIRSNESEDFLLEKLTNCIKDSPNHGKSGFGKKYVLVPQKRKRIAR